MGRILTVTHYLMEKFSNVYEIRVERLLEQLEIRFYSDRAEVQVEAYEPRGEPVSPEEAFAASYRPFQVGEAWGSPWNTVWFRVRGTVPAGWRKRKPVVLMAFSPWVGEGFTGEGLVWENGKPVGAINVNRQDIPITTDAEGGETFEFYVEAAANPRASMAGEKRMVSPEPDGPSIFTLAKAELACFESSVWELYHDFNVCFGAMRALPKDTPRRGQLLFALNEAANLLDLQDPETFSAAREALKEVMGRSNSATTHAISAIGHAHIDTAWLWPLRETIRKCARTFSTALRYMEEYPNYKFSCSQAQQYVWMKHYYPDIYAGIKKAVARGQWEPIGSMWVEVDCNIPSGESLVRQILHGKRFFMKEFGVETSDVWIPDVFGYSASMPQLMKQAGIRYFLTQKISWNKINQFPHHTFLWEGIDGTRILSHFPPANTYNGDMSVAQLSRSVSNFKENDRATRSLYPYGYGDGGGGPTRKMLETVRRCGDFEGLPRVEFDTVADFFPKAEADARDLPVWSGELYLETHRGTYTSQAKTKRGNRKCEFLLREAEFYDAVSFGLSGRRDETGEVPEHAVYDVISREEKGVAASLDRAWKLLLLNQFHDIIPGSSIHWVYQDAARDYRVIATLASSVLEAGRKNLTRRISTEKFKNPVVVGNTLSHARGEVVSDSSGTPFWAEAPACGYAVVEKTNPAPEEMARVSVSQTAEGHQIENGIVRVRIGRDGLLDSLFDLRAGREVLAAGEQGNLFQLHRDIPNQYDAWDIDVFYRENCRDLREVDSIEIVEENALRGAVEIVRGFGNSKIRQRVVLRAGSARLDFETEVDWREEQKLLKVAFPVNVRSPRATYEIQFGHTERPTHRNTSWDAARFEVCAQKWADLSESDYGVALLNDCKYGHDIFGHVMRLTLLKAAIAPDPEADRGNQRFTYSIFPHLGGGPQQGGVIEEAYALNVPLDLHETDARPGELPTRQSLFEVDRPGLVIETVKVSEEGDAIILRAYEAYGTRGPARIQTALPVKKVFSADLLERPVTELDLVKGAVALEVSPFEIVTLRFSVEA